jgi:hypothetical protein
MERVEGTSGANGRAKRSAAPAITILFVWLVIIVTGAAGRPLQPSFGGAALSLGLYASLLFLYSRFAAPGQRAGLDVYLVAGLLYLPMCLAIYSLFGSPYPEPAWFGLLGAGEWLGFRGIGEHHAPLTFILRMALNLFVPILLVVGPRRRRPA